MPHRRRPRLRTQIDLHEHWRRVLPHLGRRPLGLHFLFLAPNHQATRAAHLDVDGPLDYAERESLVRVIAHLLDGERIPWRIAFLIVRAGQPTTTSRDIAWAASLYDASRQAHVACEVVHLAAGDRVIPLPPDDMPDLAAGF